MYLKGNTSITSEFDPETSERVALVYNSYQFSLLYHAALFICCNAKHGFIAKCYAACEWLDWLIIRTIELL